MSYRVRFVNLRGLPCFFFFFLVFPLCLEIDVLPIPKSGVSIFSIESPSWRGPERSSAPDSECHLGSRVEVRVKTEGSDISRETISGLPSGSTVIAG